MNSFLKFFAGMAVSIAGLLLSQYPTQAATLSVTPSATSNTYSGNITLLVTGLTNSESVVIQKFMDANTNSVVDAADVLVQQFQLKDGQASVISGVTNINVPGDTDSTAAQITSRLIFGSGDLGFIGKYLFKLSSPSGRFTAVTNLFTVTNAFDAQSVTMSGSVRNSGTNVPNAFVLLFTGDMNLQGGTVANNSGSYTIKAAPGTYSLAAFKSNFVADLTTAPTVTLPSGASITTNLTLINATQSISGKVADAANASLGLPGFVLPFISADNLLTLAFTDTNGNFTARVTPAQWQIEGNSSGLAFFGYLALDDHIEVETSTGSVAGVTMALPKATALFYGSVKDGLNNPLAGIEISAEDNNDLYESEARTDANGNYVAGALGGGTWRVEVSNDSNPTGYIFSQSALQQNGGTNLSAGTVVLQNFTALLATNHITGYLRDNNNIPISGVSVYANANINGTDYQAAQANTDSSGNYSLNVANGNWNVGVNCCDDCDDGLDSTLYQCPGNQNVDISNGNGVVNFIVQLCAGVEITTTSLANGEVGINYNGFLNAASCDNSFTWTLNSGSLPAGLQLNSGGQIFGTPNGSGTFNFSAHVVDGNSNATNKNLSIMILPAVQITTTALPPGVIFQNIHTNLQATGGQPPYDWNIISGSLPPGVLFNTGLIDGIPTNSGTFNFTVQVIDQLGGTDNQFLTLTITGSAQPLQVATTSLSDGTLNTFYSQPVNATGGQQPYSWSLAPGSAPLPPGLNISGGGTLSGTPTNSGTFFFNVRVTDSLSATADGLLSIYIPTPSLQITTLSLPNAQQGASYTNQLQASGGQLPYGWSLAPGSLSLPPNLSLSTGGVISGTAATNGTFFFIVRVTDGSFAFTNRSLSLTINPKPTLAALNRIGNQFQMLLSGVTGQNYTLQYSTNLANPNWFSLLITNPSAASVTILDPNATNKQRFYRVVVGP